MYMFIVLVTGYKEWLYLHYSLIIQELNQVYSLLRLAHYYMKMQGSQVVSSAFELVVSWNPSMLICCSPGQLSITLLRGSMQR